MAGRGVLGKINGQRATHKRLTTCGANNEGNRKNTAIVTCCAGPHCFDNFRHWWMVWVCGRHRNDRRLCRVCMRVRAVYFFRRPVASTTTTKLHNISITDDVWPATSPKGISGERKWRKNKRLNQCGSNVSNRAIMAIVVIDRLPPSLTLMPYIFDQHRGGYTMSMTKRQYEREKKNWWHPKLLFMAPFHWERFATAPFGQHRRVPLSRHESVSNQMDIKRSFLPASTSEFNMIFTACSMT